MHWLDRIPLLLLALVAAWMAVAPINPQPHLLEKLGMLMGGTLTRPMDIFDLFFHLTPITLLLRLLRMYRRRP